MFSLVSNENITTFQRLPSDPPILDHFSISKKKCGSLVSNGLRYFVKHMSTRDQSLLLQHHHGSIAIIKLTLKIRVFTVDI